jgi:hypothetical protein
MAQYSVGGCLSADRAAAAEAGKCSCCCKGAAAAIDPTAAARDRPPLRRPTRDWPDLSCKAGYIVYRSFLPATFWHHCDELVGSLAFVLISEPEELIRDHMQCFFYALDPWR